MTRRRNHTAEELMALEAQQQEEAEERRLYNAKLEGENMLPHLPPVLEKLGELFDLFKAYDLPVPFKEKLKETDQALEQALAARWNS